MKYDSTGACFTFTDALPAVSNMVLTSPASDYTTNTVTMAASTLANSISGLTITIASLVY